MEDLLSFITGSLRQKGITVNEFCEQIGISRQKFYRFVKEPRRFTDENLRAMQNVLSLNETEIKTLNNLFYTKQTGPSNRDLSVYNPLITDLFLRRPSEELSVNMYNIEYIDASRSAAMHSPDTVARIMAGPCSRDVGPEDGDALTNAASLLHHEYIFTIYNCTPSDADRSDMPFFASRRSLHTIASIIKSLEDILCPSDQPGIHVRHYLSESQREKMMVQNIEDRDAMQFNLRLLNCILPILSSVEDYQISKTALSRHYWTSHSNCCMIEHRCTPAGGKLPSAPGADGAASEEGCEEYFALLFSDSGECSVCRLGNREASHIYRFLCIDIRGGMNLHSEEYTPENPNQHFYKIGQKSRFALIHPDLCFDDIPKEMWMALYDIVQTSAQKDYYEKTFRRLIDPFGQYAFLGFTELAEAAMNTLEQRARMNSRNGKIVICHPAALQNLARTGVITDLISESEDYTGRTKSDHPLRFPAPMVRNLLLLIRTNIERRLTSPVRDPDKYDCLNYYILHPQLPYPEVSYFIYKDYGVTAIYTRGRHNNRITNVFQNAAVGTLLYNYVTDTLLRGRGSKLDSGILSDEHAIALIDKLLLEVEG